SEAVETGRVDRFRLTGAGEGAAIAQLRGRMRLGGHVIWASDFTETVTESGGGKGQPAAPRQRSYGYSVSLAIALCEGEIAGIGRVWADGTEIAASDLNMRVYTGSADQLPDPAMEAVEGAGLVPAYRGTAYVVVEDLSLERFGNRVPQFSFEVIRPEQRGAPGSAFTPTYGLRGVALIPGTGEYALATTPVNYLEGPGVRRSANVATPRGETDFAVSLGELTRDLPELEAVSLVVSWFGDDLRCGRCRVRPKVEDVRIDGETMPWQVSGLSRAEAEQIARQDGRPVYGGTPCDAAVMEAIAAMQAVGKKVMFYPFILMEQLAGNMLPDPYSDAQSQPVLPWRGRITLEHAPGRPLSSDGTDDATAQVDAFFGAAKADDFTVSAEGVRYSGPAEWGFARFILHYAALCKAAGGVDAFCIGSEMRGLTQIRGAGGVFAAVERLRQLAREVRAILGPEVKISYAADWSEYFGYAPQDGSGDRFFHLDPLWSDETIDFIGIDNYMPLSDWREGDDHLDRGRWNSIYDADYLRANIEGGEGYDWYYRSQEARDLQIRTPITDGAHGEPWVHRYKDLRGWWSNAHHERIGGVREAEPTAWQPGSKPIWFTEYGCAAIDKGTNQPNKFLDPKSSESRLPHYSDGGRDDYLQMQYLRAVTSYWAQPAHNPVSADYGGPMIDMTRAFAWAWDARPFPAFPNDRARWSDGENYGRGHWLNGRTSNWALSAVVRDICDEAGVQDVETGRTHGAVRGYLVDRVGTGRAALQPLMLRHAFDAVEREGQLQFRQRDGEKPVPLDPERLAQTDDLGATLIRTRAAESELSGRVRVQFVEADGSFEAITEEATLSDDKTLSVSGAEVNLLMTRGEGRQVALRWLMEARVGRDRARFALPPSRSD
ncbi:baseplate multidomain protein megatron, partial [Sulfitobacter sp. HI0023]|uniref:baseplate multidomain protein megatron n=4 Tax=unclassified Sulfitobacter TaxID=196795 RepID=UPI0007C20E30